LMGVNALEKKEYLFLTHPTVYDWDVYDKRQINKRKEYIYWL
jgi:hypothetical protein